jgi:signal transduction histidine kinase/ligand-binding sensor domain-containing protein/AraC-like DNA-binding protein/ActR/RegA family two-component response regulator
MLLRAAPSEFRFRRFAVEDGLSSNCVHAIVQDHDGFIWVGTEEGLDRFDGATTRSFRVDTKTGSEYISALYAGSDYLWIGTEAGLYTYDYRTEVIQRVTVVTEKGNDIHSTVNTINEDREGNFWIATSGQGIFCYNFTSRRLKRYECKNASELIASVFIDSDNQVWAVTAWDSRSGLSRLNKAEDRFEPFQLKYSGSGLNSNALVMCEDSEHNLWLGTWESGLQRVDRYTGQATVYLLPPTFKGSLHIHSILEYAPHMLMIGSDDGLLLFDTLLGTTQLFTEDADNPSAISNRFVYPLLKDREGGIWVGTYYGGACYLSPHTGQFESYSPVVGHTTVGNTFGLTHLQGSVVSRFCEDSRGHIWIATDDGGLNEYLPATHAFNHYMPSAASQGFLSFPNVHALCADGDNLWIGTYTGGIDVLNLTTGRFRHYGTNPDDLTTLDGSSSYSIYRDKGGDIWVATMSGLNRYRPATDDFERVRDLGAVTIDMTEDRNGYLWLATQGSGIFKFYPKTQSWKNYTTRFATLPNDQTNCLMMDSEGTLWAGTMDGLCRYNPKEDTFERIPLTIESQNICGIIEDRHQLWLTTTKGLVCYTPGEGCRVFTKSDGLQSDQFLANAAFRASDGRIYVGTANGFNAFFPYRLKLNRSLPPVILTGLDIFNREVKVGDEELPLALNHTDVLELSYGDNVFSIHYAALSYCTPGKNQYAYMLEGFDKDWNYVGSETKATYTNIPPGTYIFRVKGTNNDGIWNEEGTQLRIVIHPPFYLNTAAKLLYLLLMVVAIIAYMKWVNDKAARKHALDIQRIKTEKEHEIHEAKIRFFTMIAHEIRTPVSLIMAPLESIMSSTYPLPKMVRDDLELMHLNTQRLLTLVNQLLDFRKVEDGGASYHFTRVDIVELLRPLIERFDPYIAQRKARFSAQCPAEPLMATVDKEAVTKMVSNLLTNAAKYTRDEVTLTCRLLEDESSFAISVKDNGVGISEEEQRKIFDAFYQSMDNKPGTGIGLSIVKSLVEVHHGRIDLQSEVGKGSTFTLILPLTQPDELLENLPADDGATDRNQAEDEPAAASAATSSQPAAEGGEEVSLAIPEKPVMLVVDDNEEMVQFLCSQFSNAYTLLTAGDGLEALKLLKENEVHLILSDWMMPRMDGEAFCREVRRDPRTSHIPFILLTAKTDNDSKVTGMDCGADAYIEKPFSIEYLKACIRNLLDLRRMLLDKFSHQPLMPLPSLAPTPTDNDFLTQLNAIIEDNFANSELNVDFLAEKMNISRSGLFAKIKTLADVTPGELIQLMRLKKAAALLAEGKYRVNEVSYMVGFNSPSYFSKCFQKQFGIKPGDMQKKS